MKASQRSSFGSLVRRIGAAAIAAFLLLELTTRVFLFGPAGLDPRKIDSIRQLTDTGFLRRSLDPVLAFELAPNVDGVFNLATFRTNSRGLRDREYPLAKPPKTFRVAVVGSSFTLPTGVEIEDAFHSVLERRLDRESRSIACEFINFAVGMYNARQILAMLRLRALAYDPDLVIFAVTALSAPDLGTQWDEPVLKRAFERPVHPLFESFLWKLVRVRLWPETLRPVDREPRAEKAELSVLGKLAEVHRTAGVPVVVVWLGLAPGDGTPADLDLEATLRDEGLYFVDTRPAFAGMDPAGLWISQIDSHPNREAHAIFAEVLAAFLEEHGLLP